MRDNAKRDTSDNILIEHDRVLSARHIFAIVNFLAIFIVTVITIALSNKRGNSDSVMAHLYIMLAINIIQIGLCAADFVLKKFFGIYVKQLPYVSYGVGGFWMLVVIGEMASAMVSMDVMRLDLLIIAIMQVAVAVISYVVWPSLDRKAVNAMIVQRVREDEEKRKKQAKKYVIIYAVICGALVLMQVLGLLAYKIPPSPYDLFDGSRAIVYQLNDAGDGYIVKGVYTGTAPSVNIPAYYNEKPVVGIARGALVNDGVLDKYKIGEITFGTADENGEIECNIRYIESGAIKNDKIRSLSLPSSVASIGAGAISSKSLRTVTYEASADFDIAYLNCDSLSHIVMQGENVGNIESLDGMDRDVKISVRKDIYNKFRQNNMEYIKSFEPILDSNEFYLDFYTDCDYYIESIFGVIGEPISISYQDLKNDKLAGKISPVVDTEAYIENRTELGTNGAKAESAFRGWYYDPSFSKECKFDGTSTIDIDKTTTLYAKWVPEYKGDFDWGTYYEPGQAKTLYWTDEFTVNFPQVTGRKGYADGIEWRIDGTSGVHTDSSGISKNTKLIGTWVLDKPEIDVTPVGTYNGSSNEISFTYDESKILSLVADKTHSFGTEASGDVEYLCTWKNNTTGAVYNNRDSINVQNVADSGDYTLTVKATSRYGESSTSTTNVRVTIERKPLDIGNVAVSNKMSEIYDSLNHKIDETGTLPAGISSQYEYKLESTGAVVGTSREGVKNAGTYQMKVVYSKTDAQEAANYQTETLTAKLIISPKKLQYGGWLIDGKSGISSVVYDSMPHTATVKLTGFCDSADEQQFALRYNNGTKTAASSYTTTADIDDSRIGNYSIADVKNDLRFDWKIDRREITVERWILDGTGWNGNSVVYDGNAHRVYASMSGVQGNDSVEFVYAKNDLTANSAVNAGSYTAQITGVNNVNYVFDVKAAGENAAYEWTIEQRTINVAFVDPGSAIYNGENIAFKAKLTNFAKAADITAIDNSMLVLNCSQGATALAAKKSGEDYVIDFVMVNAGTYNVEIGGFTSPSGNYKFASSRITHTFTISPRILSVYKDTAKRIYNGADQEIYINVNNVAAKDLDSMQASIFTGAGTVVGRRDGGIFKLVYVRKDACDFDVSITGVTDTNYTLEKTFTGTLEIEPKPIDIARWTLSGGSTVNLTNGQSVVYNGYSRTLNCVPNGVVAGESVAFNITNAVKKDVGDYGSVATLDTAVYPNYTFGGETLSWSITPASLRPTWQIDGAAPNADHSVVYSGSDVTVSASISPLNGDVLTLTYNASKKDLVKSNAGDYNVEITGITGDAAKNYTIVSSKSFAWHIEPKPINVSWSTVAGLVYSGGNQGPVFTLDKSVSGANVTLTYDATVNGRKTGGNKSVALSDAQDYSLSGSNGFATDAGSYSVRVSGISNGNYSIVANTCSFSIGKQTLALGGWQYTNGSAENVAVSGSASYTYNKRPYTFTKTVGVSGLDLVYSNNSITDVGNKTVEITGISGAQAHNYQLPSNGLTLNISVNPKVITATWSDDTSKIYTATEQSISVVSFTGVETGDDVSLTYAENSARSVGTYTATATSNNKNYSLSPASSEKRWTISQYTVASVDWNTDTFVYNGNVQTPKASFSLNGESVTFTYTGDTSARNAGRNYSVTAHISGSNYTTGTFTRTFVINARPAEIVWSNYTGTYDGAAHAATASLSNQVAGDRINFVYSLTNGGNRTPDRNSATNVGSYGVSVNSLDNGNYTLVGATGIANGSINISQQNAVIAWSSNNTVTYDGKEKSIVATVVGAADGKAVAHSGGAVSGTNAGTYTTTVALTDPNYKISSNATGTLTINAQPVTITWSGAGTYTYDGVTRSLSATAVGSLDKKNVSIAAISGAGSYKAVTSVTARVTALDSAATNYTLTGATNTTATLTISKRALSVNWGSETSYVYDGTAKTVTATLGNVVTGDDVAPVYTTNNASGYAVTNAINVGSYYVLVSNLNGTNKDNYSLPSNMRTGSFTITKRTVTMTESNWSGSPTVAYDGKEHTLGYTVKFGETIIASGSIVRTTVGSYPVTASLNSAMSANFALTGVTSKTLTISPRDISIEWSGTTATYNGSAQTVHVTARDSSGQEVFSTDSTPYTDAGTYGIALDISDNYHVVSGSKTATFTIAPQTVTAVWSGYEGLVYNGNVRTVHVSLKNGANEVLGDDLYTVTGNANKDAGEYVAMVIINDEHKNNYKFAGNATSAILRYEIAHLRLDVVGTIDRVELDRLDYTLQDAIVKFEFTYDNKGYDVSAEYKVVNAQGLEVTALDVEGEYRVMIKGLVGADAKNFECDTAAIGTIVIAIDPPETEQGI